MPVFAAGCYRRLDILGNLLNCVASPFRIHQKFGIYRYRVLLSPFPCSRTFFTVTPLQSRPAAFFSRSRSIFTSANSRLIWTSSISTSSVVSGSCLPHLIRFGEPHKPCSSAFLPVIITTLPLRVSQASNSSISQKHWIPSFPHYFTLSPRKPVLNLLRPVSKKYIFTIVFVALKFLK